MSNFIIINDLPLVRTTPNFLPIDICKDLIDWGRGKLVPGRVVGHDGKDTIDNTIRSASVVSKHYDTFPHYELINDLVSKHINIDKSRFEKITLTHYKKGQDFKCHQDYFIENNEDSIYKSHNDERCSKGGNRTSTVIIYLNDVEEGGQTWFPWLNFQITPQTGKLCQFNYDYDEPEYNIRTQHSSIPVIKGEKWIITIWIREQPLSSIVNNFKTFTLESNFHREAEDIEYSIECGPDWDKRTLNLTLPANNSPMNGIAVASTGGFESSLLLYLIAILNTYQKIPYSIVPILVATKYEKNVLNPMVTENHIGVDNLVKFINSKIQYPKIRNLEIIKSDRFTKENPIINGLQKVFGNYKKWNYLSYVNFQYVYLGDNELPNDDDSRWKNINFSRIKSPSDKWVQPFFNLQKYHILDLYLKLGLLDIFQYIGKCTFNHRSLSDNCESFACNERRWSFLKLNKQEIGDKYFTSKETKYD